MIHCPLYHVDFDVETKDELVELFEGCIDYEEINRCNSRIGTGVCVAEEAECE